MDTHHTVHHHHTFIIATMNSPNDITDTAAAKDDHVVQANLTAESTTAHTQDMSLISEDYSNSHNSKLESPTGSKEDVVVNEQTQVRKVIHYQGAVGSQAPPEVTSGHLRSVRWAE